MIFYYPDGNGGRNEVDLLPTASDSVKGGIKVGGGLSMNGDILSAITFDLPIAGASTLGGIKVGNGLEMFGDTLNCTAYNVTVISGESSGGISFPNDPLPGWITFVDDGGYIYNGSDWLPLGNDFSSMPVAGASTLGGIKVGNGLSMRGDTLNAIPYELPVAGESTLGGIKVGIGLYMNQDSLQATSNMFFAGVFNDSLFPDWAERGCVVQSDGEFFLFDGEEWFHFCNGSGNTGNTGNICFIGSCLANGSMSRAADITATLTYSAWYALSGRNPNDDYAPRVGDIVYLSDDEEYYLLLAWDPPVLSEWNEDDPSLVSEAECFWIRIDMPKVFEAGSFSYPGKKGLVPAPQHGDDEKYLRGNGTWSVLTLGTVPSAEEGAMWLSV